VENPQPSTTEAPAENPSETSTETSTETPKVPERAAGDTSPITLTGNQIAELLKNEEYASTIQARIEYEIDRWNGWSEEQRRAVLAGDYSGFSSQEDADWARRGVEYLRKYGVLNAAEPENVTMPAPAEEPAPSRAQNIELNDGSVLNMDGEGNATISLSEEAEERMMMERANRYEPINDVNDTRDIMVSDERIKQLNPNGAPTDDELRKIRTVLMGWNRMEPRQRKMLLEGDFDATGSSRLNGYLAENFNILRKFNIITVPEPEAGVSDEGEASAAA
jgi:hypothetical protein